MARVCVDLLAPRSNRGHGWSPRPDAMYSSLGIGEDHRSHYCRIHRRTRHEAAIRSRYHPPDRTSRGPERRGGAGSSLGPSRARLSGTRQPAPRSQPLAFRGRCQVPEPHAPSSIDAGRVVRCEPPTLPGGCTICLGTGAPSRRRRASHRERQDAACTCRHAADTVERIVSRPDPGAARSMVSGDQRRVPEASRLLR